MKKIILSTFVFAQLLLVSAGVRAQATAATNMETAAPEKVVVYTSTKKDNIKLYQQPSLNANVLRTVGTADQIEVMREFNNNWTMVKVGDQAGYIMKVNLVKQKK